MERRRLGKTDIDLPAVGFGGMRLTRISQDEATAAVRRAIELDVNFFETSRWYGDSEIKLGVALEGLREKAIISTKSSKRDGPSMRRELEESLKRLKTDYLDLYHMWFVNDMASFRALMKKGGALEEAKKAREEGLVRRIGITGHAKNEEMIEFCRSSEFVSITVYYNAHDVKVEPVVEEAARLGMGVIAMGPLKGGFLASPSERLSFLARRPARTQAQGAVRWLISDERVTSAIVGFQSAAQVEEAVEAEKMPRMTPEGRAGIVRSFDAFEKLKEGVCSSCEYCKDCPEGVPISQILGLHVQARVYGVRGFAREQYSRLKVKADACEDCGECLEKCPQKLDIPKLLEEAHAELSSGGGKA